MVYRNNIAFESEKALNMVSASFKICLKPFPKRLPGVEYVSEALAERFLYAGVLFLGGMLEGVSKRERKKFFNRLDECLNPEEKAIVYEWAVATCEHEKRGLT